MATSLPPPTESSPNCLPSSSLPSAGSVDTIHRRHLRFLVPAGHSGGGEWRGCGTEAGRRGGGGCFGGCVGEWRRLFLHTSPSLRSPPWLSPSFLWLPFFLCCLFWSWSDLPPFVPYYGCICFNTNRRRSHTHDSHANIASYPQTWIRSASVSSVIVRETVLPRLAMWMSARVALWVVDTHHFITQEMWASRFT